MLFGLMGGVAGAVVTLLFVFRMHLAVKPQRPVYPSKAHTLTTKHRVATGRNEHVVAEMFCPVARIFNQFRARVNRHPHLGNVSATPGEKHSSV